MDQQDKIYLWMVATSLAALVVAIALSLAEAWEISGYNAGGAF